MDRRLLVVFAVIILGAAVLFLNLQEPPREEKIRIGAVLPLTTRFADQGQASQQGILLAVEEINSRGGINGRQVEVLFENSECEAQKAATAMNKLVHTDGVKMVVGDICSSATLAMAPIAEENKVLLLNAGSTASTIRHSGDYVFRFWFSGEEMGRMIAEKAFKSGITKMAVIYLNNDFGHSLEKNFSTRFEELGGTVVSKERVDTESTDFRTEFIKAEERNPDAYLLALYHDGILLALRQFREYSIDKEVFSHGGIALSALASEGESGVLDGLLAPFAAEESEEFGARFREKFGQDPGVTADAAYDAIMVLAKVMEEKGTEIEKIKQGLYEIENYPGVSGKITIDTFGETNRPLTLYKVENGKMAPVE